ncbi:MAG TPA: thioredoxin family protein [Chitinophagaceae bacterium]|nr:thioredoxin family protein [Chitinophagaceae bacterium]
MLKKILILIITAFLTGGAIFAQSQAEISRDNEGNKILKGIISRKELENDTSFTWWAENLKGFTPQSQAVAELKKNQNIQFIAFMGTWCGDSKFIIPKFYSLLDVAGFSQDKVTLIGVDRNKKTLSHLAEALNIENVPTIIVMNNGKEIGRVVEYGKYGSFDKELGEIIASIPASPGQ